MVTPEQVAQARQEAADSEEFVDAVDILKKKGIVQEQELLAMLAQQYGMELLDLSHYDIPQEVIDSMSGDIALHYRVVPVMKHDNLLTIAMSDPTDMETLDTLRYLLGGDVDAVIAPQRQIDLQIAKHYADETEQVNRFLGDANIADADMLIEQNEEAADSRLGEAETAEDADAPIIRLVTKLLIDAYKMKASDIHFEPMEKRYRVRYRVDGALREVDGPPKYLQANFTSRIKIMSHLDITEKRIPQDGRIQLSVGDKDIDLRVSSIPTTHGESVVMRILDKASIQLDIPKLGFYADDLELVNRIISLPDGIFLVTGPTGSGKTTTLYSALGEINNPEDKLLTAEDPVEYDIEGIIQCPINDAVGMTFERALRAFLRQDPDRILVGEIRDFETAQIAIEASLTGHFVFSTLHTNDAASTVTRLVDMGVEPFLISSSLAGVLGQRLIRRVCKNCKTLYTPTDDDLERLNLTREEIGDRKFCYGKGCPTCNYTGYKGRKALTELLVVNGDIRELISDNAPTSAIRDKAREQGMRTLREDGLAAIFNHESSVDEVVRYT